MITGYYLDGKTSNRTSVRLDIFNRSTAILVLSDVNNNAELGRFNFTDIKISSRLGNTPREIRLPDGGLFVSEQNQQIDDMIKALKAGVSVSLMHRLESHFGLIFVSLVVALLVTWLTISQGIPRVAESLARNMPAVMVDQFDTQMKVLDSTIFEQSKLTQQEQDNLRELFQPYLDQHSNLNPVLHIRTGIGVNALALPGGDIVFTDELIKLAGSDEQLISVLFHELGHLEQRHFLRRTLQSSMTAILLLFVVGDLETLDLVVGIPAVIADLSYSIDFEREADLFALEQMHRNGLDLDAFGAIMLRMVEADGNEELGQMDELEGFLSTHPKTEDRAAMVEQFRSEQR